MEIETPKYINSNGRYCIVTAVFHYSQNKNPNPSPTSEEFGFDLFGEAGTYIGELMWICNILSIIIYFN